MPVFKMYFKILKAHAKISLLYAGIFLMIFFIFSQITSSNEGETAFTSTKVEYVLEDQDHSSLSSSLSAYLASQHQPVDMAYDEQSIKDAMFFEEIQVYIQIPEGFEQALLEGREPQLILRQKPDYAAGAMLSQQVNAYVGNVQKYLAAGISNDMSSILQNVEKDLSRQVSVEMVSNQDVAGSVIQMSMYFSYLAYIMMALFFMLGGLILTSINEQTIRMRNLISPISTVSFNLQLFGAFILSAFGLWLFFIVSLQCMVPNVLWSEQGVYFLINSILFLLECMGLTYLISTLLAGMDKAEEKLNGMANVLCLGMSFLGGVFIPQMMLSEGVKLVGSFLPTFWYVKAINEIVATQEFRGEALTMVLQCFGIQLLFALAFFLLALFISRMKTSSRSLDTNDLGASHL